MVFGLCIFLIQDGVHLKTTLVLFHWTSSRTWKSHRNPHLIKQWTYFLLCDFIYCANNTDSNHAYFFRVPNIRWNPHSESFSHELPQATPLECFQENANFLHVTIVRVLLIAIIFNAYGRHFNSLASFSISIFTLTLPWGTLWNLILKISSC